LHEHVSTEGLDTNHPRCEDAESYSTHPRSPPLRPSRASPENPLGHEGQGEEATDEDDRGQQQVPDVAAVVTAERVGVSLPDGSPRLAGRPRRLRPRNPSPEAGHDGAGSHRGSGSDGELDSGSDSDENDRKPRSGKRKRPSLSSSSESLAHKKRKLQLRPTRQLEPRLKSHRRSPKSLSQPKHSSRVAARSGAEGSLPSPAPSAPRAVGAELLSKCCSTGELSRSIPPTLIEATFRPHSPHCCSFTAVIQDGCDGKGVSVRQLAQLVENIAKIGRIDDFMIKPIEQNSFLVTGMSRQTSSVFSPSGTSLSTAGQAGSVRGDATLIRPQYGRSAHGTLASLASELSSSDDESSLSERDPDASSDDDRSLSGDEQDRKKKHSPWSDLDEQRLLAYKKEGKSWSWIFRKFPGRTQPAIRTRWNMVRSRDE